MAGIFVRIFNMSLSAGWIVLAVLLLRLLLKNAPKWWRVLLWGVVALRLVMPFTIESAVSLMPAANTVTMPEQSPRPIIQSGIGAVDRPANEYLSSHYYEGVTRPVGFFEDITTLFAVIWAAGVAVMLIYTLISYVRLKQRVRTAVLLHDNIYLSDNIPSPFVLGLIKPKIYLPFGMDEGDIAQVAAHENAHIRRRDHLIKPFGFLLLALHWFNPLLWLGYVLLCRDIELACDERVIKELDRDQKADYSRALLNCSINRRSIAACPLAFGEVGVKTRIKQVLSYRKPAFWIIAAAFVAAALLAVCFLTDRKGDDMPSAGAAEPPVMVVVSNEQSIEAARGTASWMYRLPDGTGKGVNYDSSHPLTYIGSLPRIDIIPAYNGNTDPLSALLSFNIGGDPANILPPDEIQVVCWQESEWYKPDPLSQNIPVTVANGNIFISMVDGSCVYEVTASWNGADSCSGTVRNAFCAQKFTVNLNIQNAAVIEITALGNGGFCQITDDTTIAKIVDKVNQITFAGGKEGESKGDAYEIKFYDRRAQLIDKIVMMSDREILYGRDNTNYIAIQNGSLGYDYIDILFKEANGN